MMQRYRSHRLRMSYNLDKYQLGEHTILDDEELFPKEVPCIVIKSDDEQAVQIESESESAHLANLVNLRNVEEEDDDGDHEIDNDSIPRQPAPLSQKEHFAKIQAQFQQKIFQINQQQLRQQILEPSPEKIYPEQQLVEPISYNEYKTFFYQQMHELKLKKAEEKLKAQEATQLQEKAIPKAKPPVNPVMPIVTRKEDESMGEFMSRIVNNFEKENKKRVRRRPQNQQRENSKPREVSLQRSDTGKPLTLEEQIMNEMIKSYQEDKNQDRPEQQELLNYDVLLRTNRIIKRVLMPPPRFKDDFLFTHLYQEDQSSPKQGRKKKKNGKTVVIDPSIRFNTVQSADRQSRSNAIQIQNPQNQLAADLPSQPAEERQMKKLQIHRVQKVVSKRVNALSIVEYSCLFERARKSWIQQNLLMKEYSHILLEFEKNLMLLQFENKVAEKVDKIRDSNTYCILSHKISMEQRENPKIVYFKQSIQTELPPLHEEQEEIRLNSQDHYIYEQRQDDFELEQQTKALAEEQEREKMVQILTGTDKQNKRRKHNDEEEYYEPKPKKIRKKLKKIEKQDDGEADFFKKQFEMMQIEQNKMKQQEKIQKKKVPSPWDIVEAQIQQDEDKREKKVSFRDSKVYQSSSQTPRRKSPLEDEDFEKEIKHLRGESTLYLDEPAFDLEREFALLGKEKNSFKKKIQEQRLHKMILALQSKRK